MRVGIIGAGHWHSGMHAKGVLESGGQLAGVWDPDAKAIARFIAANGGEARPDAAAVLHDRPDMIIALGRGPEAAARLGWLIEHDIPVLADKPIGLSHEDVAPLVAAAEARKRFVAVALVNRIAGVIETFDDRPVHMYFRIINGHPHRYRDWHVPWMLDPQQSGGGALRNLGVHGVDAFLTLAGVQDVRLEHASLHSVFGEGVEDYAAVVLRAEDGCVGFVEAGYTHPGAGGTYEFRINGVSSALVDDGSDFAAANYVQSGRRYGAFVGDTLARIRSGRPPAVSLAEFARATKLIDQAYRQSAH